MPFLHHKNLSVSGILFTRSSSVLSRLICWATRGPYSHCALILYPTDLNGKPVLLECVFEKDRFTKKRGLRAVYYDDQDFPKWYQCDKDPCSHFLPLDLSQEEVDNCYSWLMPRIHVIYYATLQLFSLLPAASIGLLLSKLKPSKYHWTCSETVARALPSRLQKDALLIGFYRYEEIAPSGSKLPSLLNKLTSFYSQ